MQTKNKPIKQPNQHDTLAWARYYVSKGFSVIPLRPRSKIAALRAWKPYRERRPTYKELIKWFKNTKYNIAIVHGPISGTMAIDLDEPEAIEFYNLNSPPKTPMFSTSTEGRFQVLLKYPNTPGKIQIRKDILGLENRQEGNYSAVPPSIGPVEEDKEKKGLKTGLQYEWITTLEDAPLAELPQWLLETPIIQRPTQVRKPLTASEIVQQLLEAKEALTHIPADDYHVWLKIGMALHSSGAGDLAYQIWEEWSRTSQKFNEKDQNKTWQHFKEKENQITLATLFALAKEHGWKHYHKEGAQKQEQKIIILTSKDIKERYNTTYNFIWKQHILEAYPTMIAGREGDGKTTAIATIIKESLDKYPKGKTLLLPLEGNIRDFLRKVEDAGIPENRYFLLENPRTGDFSFNFDKQENLEYLDKALERIKPLIVFIDSLRRISGYELKSDRFGNVATNLNEIICDRHGAAVIWAHHLTKSEKTNDLDKILGSATLAASMRLVLIIKRRGIIKRRLICIKDNPAIEPPELETVKIKGKLFIYEPKDVSDETMAAKAEKLLTEMFAEKSEWPAHQCYKKAGELGVSDDVLKRKKAEMGIQSIKGPFGWNWVSDDTIPENALLHSSPPCSLDFKNSSKPTDNQKNSRVTIKGESRVNQERKSDKGDKRDNSDKKKKSYNNGVII